MKGFERRKVHKEKNVLWTALGLFKAYGSKKASMSDIARKVGVSPVTIYSHFGSKQELTVKSLSRML